MTGIPAKAGVSEDYFEDTTPGGQADRDVTDGTASWATQQKNSPSMEKMPSLNYVGSQRNA